MKYSILDYRYVYMWGNNEKRKLMKGRLCRVVVRGKMNSALIEFENGQCEVVSRNSVMRWLGRKSLTASVG